MENTSEELTTQQIETLKVADLKKELKQRGLSIAGNKSELAARLQEAIIVDDIDNIDEKVLLVEDKNELELLEGVDVPPSPELLQSPVEKTPPSLSSEEQTPIETTGTKRTLEEGEENSENEETTEPTKIAKISSLTTLSDTERQALRTSKFTAATATEQSINEKLEQRAKRFKLKNKSSSVTDSSNSTPTSIDQLKKRAERFGGNSVSPLMKTLEDKEKLLKRQERFGIVEKTTKQPGGLRMFFSKVGQNIVPVKLDVRGGGVLATNKNFTLPNIPDNESKKLLRKQRFNL